MAYRPKSDGTKGNTNRPARVFLQSKVRGSVGRGEIGSFGRSLAFGASIDGEPDGQEDGDAGTAHGEP